MKLVERISTGSTIIRTTEMFAKLYIMQTSVTTINTLLVVLSIQNKAMLLYSWQLNLECCLSVCIVCADHRNVANTLDLFLFSLLPYILFVIFFITCNCCMKIVIYIFL